MQKNSPNFFTVTTKHGLAEEKWFRTCRAWRASELVTDWDWEKFASTVRSTLIFQKKTHRSFFLELETGFHEKKASFCWREMVNVLDCRVKSRHWNRLSSLVRAKDGCEFSFAVRRFVAGSSFHHNQRKQCTAIVGAATYTRAHLARVKSWDRRSAMATWRGYRGNSGPPDRHRVHNSVAVHPDEDFVRISLWLRDNYELIPKLLLKGHGYI